MVVEDKELEKLHKAVSEKFNIGDFDTFKSKMETPEQRKRFYDAVGEKGFSLGDYGEYEERLKKKDDSNSTVPVQGMESDLESGSSGYPENKEIKQPDVNITKLSQDFETAKVVSDDRKQEIVQSVDDEINQSGTWNNIKALGKKGFNALIDKAVLLSGVPNSEKESLSERFKLEISPLDKELKIVDEDHKKAVVKARENKQAIPTLSEDERLERARELRINNKIESESRSQVDAFLEEAQSNKDAYGISDKDKLLSYNKGKLQSIQHGDKVLLDKAKLFGDMVLNTEKEIESIRSSFRNGEITKEDALNELEVQKKRRSEAAQEGISIITEFSSKEEDLGTLKDNIDLLKRNYHWFSNIVGNIDVGVDKLAAGAIDSARWIGEAVGVDNHSIDNIMLQSLSGNLRKSADTKTEGLMKPLSVDDLDWNSKHFANDFGNYLSILAGQQAPIMASVATGAPGIAALGFSSAGEKYDEMTKEEANENQQYSYSQKLFAPLAYGASETASALVDRMIMMNTARVLRSATTIERKSIAKGFASSLLSLGKNTIIESVDEGATEIAQNIIDIAFLGKEDVDIYDNVKDAMVAGGLMGAAMSSPAFAFSNYKGIKSGINRFVTDTELSVAQKLTLNLQDALINESLTDKEFSIIEDQFKKAATHTISIAKEQASRISELSNEEFIAINSINKEQKELKDKAKEIESGDLNQDLKDAVLNGLKSEFNALEQRRKGILEGDANAKLSVLPQDEIIRLKDQAGRELMEELNPDGTKTITIEDAQISERALENYQKEQSNTILENEEAQSEVIEPNGEVRSGIDEVGEVRSEPENQTSEETVSEGVPATDNKETVREPKVTTLKTSEKGAEYAVSYENGALTFKDKNGNTPSRPTVRALQKEYAKHLDFTEGTEADLTTADEGVTANAHIAEHSQNASQIAEAIALTSREEYQSELDYKQRMIAENLGGVSRESFIEHGDANYITQSIAMQYFGKKGEGMPLDVIAQEISEIAGVEVTEQDIIDFIVDNPRGKKDFLERDMKADLNALKTAFTDVTGLPATNEFLEQAQKQKNNKETYGTSLDYMNEEDFLYLQNELNQYYEQEGGTTTTQTNDIGGERGDKGSDTSRNGKESRVQEEGGRKDRNSQEKEELGSSNENNSRVQEVAARLEESTRADSEKLEVGNKKKKGINQRPDVLAPGFTSENDFDASPSSNANIQNKVKEKGVEKEPKQKKQAFTTRSFNSENLNESVKEKLEELGLEYDVESQSLAQENAEKIINEVGIADAYILARDGKVRGGARMWIMAQMFEDLNQQISNALNKKDTELANYLSDELALIMKVFANEKTLNGQETAMLNRIYNKFDMKYDLGFSKENWEKKFGEEMPVEVEAILKKQKQNIDKLERQIKELEDKVGTLEEQEALNNIKDSVSNKSKEKPSDSSLKKAASALRKAKFTKTLNDLNKLQSDPTGVLKGIFDGAIEVVATALEAGDTMHKAVLKGINEIKKSKWYKKLSDEGKEKADRIVRKELVNIVRKELSIPTEDVTVEQGAIKIKGDLLYRLVASGIDNIKDLTDAVHKELEQNYPNLTHREVRDAITGYGKQINDPEDVVKAEISRLRTDGKQLSALEDLSENKRPLRSGRKPKIYTSEQRNRIKQIRELLKRLPIDDSVDKSKYYKNALESYKSRLKNRLSDLQDAIDKNERIIKEKRNTPLDEEAKKLIEQRDELQKEYDDHFGKPIKSDETLINEAVNRKEKSLRNLELELEFVKNNQKQSPKAEPRKVTDAKINELDERISDKRKELNDLLEEVGIAEAKRLERAKKYQRKRLSDLQEKLANKDFTKRKPLKVKYDRELSDLKLKVMEAKTRWDIEFEKQELKRRGIPLKVIDVVFKTFGTIKGLKASADLSALLRQGIMLGLLNPKEFGRSAVAMHKFAFNSPYYKKWMAELESSDDYINILEDGVFIADNTVQRLRQEEAFMDSMLSKIPIAGSITGGSERAYSGFLNMLRVEVYRKYAADHIADGYTREKDPEVFKTIGSYINSATLRGPGITTDPTWNRALNAFFFSPKAITAPLGLVKMIFNPNTSFFIRKRAAGSLIILMGVYAPLMNYMLKVAHGLLVGGDDEDEPNITYNPLSTDFSKLKIGSKRYDSTAGVSIQLRTASRYIMNKKIDANGRETSLYQNYFNDDSDELFSFFGNKRAPVPSILLKAKKGKHPTEFRGDLEDATVADFAKALFLPIGIEEVVNSIKEEEEIEQILFDFILNTYGIGVQDY